MCPHHLFFRRFKSSAQESVISLPGFGNWGGEIQLTCKVGVPLVETYGLRPIEFTKCLRYIVDIPRVVRGGVYDLLQACCFFSWINGVPPKNHWFGVGL